MLSEAPHQKQQNDYKYFHQVFGENSKPPKPIKARGIKPYVGSDQSLTIIDSPLILKTNFSFCRR